MTPIRGERKSLLFGITLGLALLSAGPAFAADNVPPFPWADWIVSMINLSIFLFIIIKFGRKPIQDFFAKRREDFLADMNAAKRAREEAESRLEELNAKLEALEKERQALLDEYHAQGEREKDRMVEAAKRQVEKMRADAELTIEQEVKKAVATLQEQAVEMALSEARKKAQERLDQSAQDKLFDDYLGQLKRPGSSLN